MPAKEERQNDEESGARDIRDIPDHRYPAMLALCCCLPLGYLALFCFYKTIVYKEQNEYEKARAASEHTFSFALASILVGIFMLLLLFYQLFFM